MMLFAEAMGPASTRSSLEVMLDAIRRKDKHPEDLPPALPARPTSRGRLPTWRKSLPVNFPRESNGYEMNLGSSGRRMEAKEDSQQSSGISGGSSPDLRVAELESCEQWSEEVNCKCRSTSLAVNMSGHFKSGEALDYFLKELAVLEAAKAHVLQGILCSQKYFRGARARRIFVDIKKGVVTLQSFIRAEGARREFQYLVHRHRAAVLIQKNVKQWVVRKAFAKQQEYIVLLQSVIRSWLAKEHLNLSRNLEMTKYRNVIFEGDQNNLYEQKQHSPVEPSDMTDLKNRVLKAEAEMRDLEKENLDLRKQLQQYEIRWSGYDLKMKSMEEMWQKQMSSLQMSLAAAKRSLATNDVANLTGRPDPPSTSPYFDYEDTMSVETYTTERSRAGTELNSTPDALRNTVTDLVKEFEEQKRIFEDDAGFIVEVKSGVSISNINPDEEFRKLKAMFASWKKSYVARLRETKKALRKLGTSGSTKTRRRWWCTRTSK